MTINEHSPERDEELFAWVEKFDCSKDFNVSELDQILLESVGIAKKWRAKANMREARIKELEQELKTIQKGMW